MKKESGITLIALVITIIVLLILAGVSLSLITSEQGVLKKAETAAFRTKKESFIEKTRLEIMDKQAENLRGGITEKELMGILEKNGTLSTEEENLLDKTLTVTNEDFKVKVSEIWSGEFYKDKNAKITFTLKGTGGEKEATLTVPAGSIWSEEFVQEHSLHKVVGARDQRTYFASDGSSIYWTFAGEDDRYLYLNGEKVPVGTPIEDGAEYVVGN